MLRFTLTVVAAPRRRNQRSDDRVTGSAMITGDERKLDLGTFLKHRRARLSPEDVGLPRIGRRRVPGLRREEVAALAGISVTWYTMIESGVATNVSAATAAAIASALNLTAAEEELLAILLDAPKGTSPAADCALDEVTARLIDTFVIAPAYVMTDLWEAVFWNHPMAFVWDIHEYDGRSWNGLRRMLEADIRAMHGARWHDHVAETLARVRIDYARRREDPAYGRLLDEILRDPDVREIWDLCEVVQSSQTSRNSILSPTVGPFTYDVANLAIPNRPELTLVVQIPDRDSEMRLRDANVEQIAS